MRKTDQDISKLNFILYTAGKFKQCCALIVTGKISKEFIGECWTYSISVLPKLQLFGVSRANLRERNMTSLLFNSHLALKQESGKNCPNRPESYTGDMKVNPTQKGTEMFIMLKRKLF